MTNLEAVMITDAMMRECIKSIIKEYNADVFEIPDLGPVPAISTGSIALDMALGCGGIPRGRITIIAGEEATGKSTLCMEIIKSAQIHHPDKFNLYVDMESGAFTGQYAADLGIDLDPNKFILIKPDYAEQGFVIIHRLISTGKVAVCVWDSIAGSFTKESAANSAEDNDSRGLTARLLSNQLRKLANKCSKTGTALVMVNQMRTQMTQTLTWVDITGGRAQKFYSSVRIDVSKDKNRDFSGNVDRETITARTMKSKVAVPYKEAKYDILLGHGILKEANILDVADKKGISMVNAKGAGHYYFYDKDTGEEVAYVRGKDKAVDWLREHPTFASQIEKAILGYQRDDEYDSAPIVGEEEVTEETIARDLEAEAAIDDAILNGEDEDQAAMATE